MNNKSNDLEHSGFENPICAVIYPKGTTFEKMPDDSMRPICPEGSEPKVVWQENDDYK